MPASVLSFDEAIENAIAQMIDRDWIKLRMEEDPRMKEFFPIFQYINSLGYLTYDSQSGQSDKKHTERERAYMENFMKPAQALAFIQKINSNTDKVACYIPTIEDPSKSKNKRVLMAGGYDVPLTISKDKTKVITHRCMITPESQDKFMRSQVKLSSKEDVVVVFCFDPLWNRKATDKDGLFTDIINYLELH